MIITLGKDGAVFASASEPRSIHVRTPKVEEVLDTTVGILFDQFNQCGLLTNYIIIIIIIVIYRVLVMHLLELWHIIWLDILIRHC